MAKTITIQILSATGNHLYDVDVPVDSKIGALTIVLAKKLELPLKTPSGQTISYRLNRADTGKQLLSHQTLIEAGVKTDDSLRILREILAG